MQTASREEFEQFVFADAYGIFTTPDFTAALEVFGDGPFIDPFQFALSPEVSNV